MGGQQSVAIENVHSVTLRFRTYLSGLEVEFSDRAFASYAQDVGFDP